MGVENKRLCSGLLTTNASEVLYTAPADVGAISIVKSITFCNTNASAAAITLKFDGVPVISNYSLAAYDTMTIPAMDQIIEASDTIVGFASMNVAIQYYISGKEVT